MQLKKLNIKISQVAILAILASNALQAENYVSMEFLKYDENDDRVSVLAPTFSASYDIGTDYNVKASFMHDTITGATPTWQPDSGSGASSKNNSGDYVYENQAFNDARNEGSLMVTTRFANRDELYIGANYSRESDYDSKSVSAEYLHYIDSSHNQSVNIGASYAFNEILSFNNNESRSRRDRDDDYDDYDDDSGASQKEESQSLNVQLGFSQVLNEHSIVKVEAFAILDNGYLTNPHASVVRDYGLSNQRLVFEKRPDKRTAYGTSLKYITLFADDFSYQGNYRFYTDDWEISSHTLENDMYYELNKEFTFGAGLRYYTQTEASFYNPSKDFFSNEEFASSDYRLSAFDALTYKASMDFKQSKNVSYNLGAEFYTQSTGLTATMITTGLKYLY